jgi:hypothetical protein
MDMAIPWMTLQKMSIGPEVEKTAKIEEILLSTIPHRKIFFLPKMSDARPKGTRKAAAESR